MKSKARDQRDSAAPGGEPSPHRDARTYVDDGVVRFYRHPPASVRAFEVVLNVGDRVSNLTIGTPDGIHEIDVEIRAHRQGAMQPVLRVHGQAASDGRPELIVTNLLAKELEVIHV